MFKLADGGQHRGVHGGARRQLYRGVCSNQEAEGRGRVTGQAQGDRRAKYNHGTEFNTVIFAIGHSPSGWRVWAWRSTPRTGRCCTTSWSGPAWTTSTPSATCWSSRAVSSCAPRYGRTTESSCYWLLNFPFVGVHPAGAHLLRPGGGGGHRADRRGECGGVSPELNIYYIL